ncbi:MAG: protein kinase [Blastocatellia bacterium]|nr:protein kinase [Blastocatellia bacterium]
MPHNKLFKKHSLSSQLLVAFLLIALIPLTIISAITAYNYEQSLKKNIETSLNAIAERQAYHIENYMKERQKDALTLAKLPDTVRAIRAFSQVFQECAGVDCANYETTDQRFRGFLSYYQESFGYTNLLLISTDGTIFFSARKSNMLGTNILKESESRSHLVRAFEDARNNQHVCVSDFTLYKDTPTGFIAVNVMEDSSIVGIAVFEINNSELYQVVNNHTGLGETGETTIAARDGNFAVFLIPTRHDFAAAFRTKTRIGSREGIPVQQAVQKMSGSGITLDYRGEEVLAVWKYLPTPRWGMVVKIDTVEAFTPVKRIRMLAILIVIITTVLASILSLVLAHSISQPIIRLTLLTDSIANGDFSQKIELSSKNEIGQLALSFSKMTAKLSLARERIETQNEQLVGKNRELEKALEDLAQKHKELIKSKEDLIKSHKRAEQIFAALSDVLPGTILDGKYKLEDKIGAGGFGAVYKGIHLMMHRPVAIKVFRPSPANSSVESLERFHLEAISTCRINHPNAVSVLDSGISGNQIAYLVMELLQGKTLAAELEEKGKISVRRAAEIILPVCDVLHKAHSSAIVHRDIKPDNIFLHKSGEGEVVKVVDFGIAKLQEDSASINIQNLTEAGSLLGTPAYMAPERLEEKPYDGKADVYSVGIMLYQMLTGKVPFQPESGGFWAIMVLHISQPPTPIREVEPNISTDVEAVVMQALEKDPQKRPNAKELAEKFAAAVGISADDFSSGDSYNTSENRMASEQPTATTKLKPTASNRSEETSSLKQPFLESEE